MAGWCQSGSESDDDEPLNLTLFARKNFGFVGFPKEKEDTLRKIVQVSSDGVLLVDESV